MKKFALLALLLCVGVVVGCSEAPKGASSSSGAPAPAASGTASAS